MATTEREPPDIPDPAAGGTAGLTRGFIAASVGLLIWLALGTTVVRWYDRKGLHRLRPDLLAYVQKSIGEYQAQRQAERQAASTSGPDPGA